MNKPRGQPDYWIYLAAYQALQTMIPVCHTDVDFDDSGEIDFSYLIPCEHDAEKCLVKKMMKEVLSEEAKFIIDLVTNTPPELEQLIFGKRFNRIPKEKRLRKLVKERLHWSSIKTNRIFKEVKNYVRQYCY